jgi:SAM-dependent methyltransferase
MAISQPELRELLTAHRQQNWQGIQTPAWQEKIVADLLADREPEILNRIAAYWKLPANPLVLDVGSGVGNFVVNCRGNGIRAFGVEPDRIGHTTALTSIQIAKRRVDFSVFASSVGEQLPFRDATFDLVTLNQVIEHVQNQSAVLAEALRVVKPGGAVYVACPNYLRFYEPHYKVAFLPLMPKWLAALHLRLRGRDPVLLEQLHYTTNWRVRRLLRRYRLKASLDLNCEDFSTKWKRGNFSSTKGWLLRKISALPGVGNLLLCALIFRLRLREGGSEFLVLADG